MCQFRELFLTSSKIRTSCSSSSYSTFPLADQFIPSHHLQVAPISLWIKYWKGNWTKFIQEIDNDYDSFSLSFFNFFPSSPSMTDNNGGGLPSTHHPFYKFNRHRKYARGQTNKGTLKFGSSCGKYSATEFTLVGRVQEHEDREKEGKLNGIEICRAVFLVARITFGRRPLSHWGGHVDNKEPLFATISWSFRVLWFLWWKFCWFSLPSRPPFIYY